MTTSEPAEEAANSLPPRQDENSIVTIEGFRYRDQEFDHARIEVTAKKASLVKRRFRYFRTALGRVVEMEGPVFSVRDKDNGIIKISSRTAVVDHAKKEVFFSGDCKIITPDGHELSSENIEWEYAKGYVKLIGEYTLKKNGKETRGKDVYVDIGLGEFKRIM